jgi:type IV pilus assembly protein PilW
LSHAVTSPRYRRHRGFSLVEVLVGIVIGMVGVLVIFQTVSIWDSHVRTTKAGGDAQSAGTLALFSIERDLRLAGMGFGKAGGDVMGCVVHAHDTGDGRAFDFNLFPMHIEVGADGAPDEIRILYGNSSFYVSEETFTASTASTKKLARRNGFRRGDVAVVAGNGTGVPGASDCALVQITDNTDVDGFTVAHASGNYSADAVYAAASGASAAARFNDAGGTGTTFSSGTIYNLGPAPRLNLWRIDGQRLVRTDVMHNAGPFEVAEGVVSLKAQYGYDLDGDNRIADTPGAPEWITALPTPVDWTKVRALRVALLVRSSQFEKSADPSAGASAVAVTASAPSWSGGEFAMTNVDGTPDAYGPADAVPNNWRYYRYRVYEQVIPLRNMIWGTAP